MLIRITNKASHKIADKDIACYKTGVWDNYTDTFISGVSSSWLVDNVPIQKRDYKMDIVQPTVELSLIKSDIPKDSDSFIINGGYHSYSSMVDYRTSLIYLDCHGQRRSMAMFIIPKGTRYYENDNFYISETIVFKKRYTRKEYLELNGIK
jgi:hypothetical protein